MRSNSLFLILLCMVGATGALAQFSSMDWTSAEGDDFNLIAGPFDGLPEQTPNTYVANTAVNIINVYGHNLTGSESPVVSMAQHFISIQSIAGSSGTPPTITACDLFAGVYDPTDGYYLYEANNGFAYVWAPVEINNGWPTAQPQLLMTLTIDASSATPGTVWGLTWGTKEDSIENLIDYADSQGKLYPYDLYLTDGTLTVVPEPSQFALVGGLALLGFAGWRRSRK